MNTINFKLDGLSCEACIKIATGCIEEIPGVKEIKIDLATGQAEVVSAAEINLDMIRRSLADTTYKITN
ncbi:TPA: hypothetical protein DCZ15_00735 [Candidatus Falkowbacteria bacterium]|nr:MAG: Copper chaperone CopZ [Candidatus Falkowbacteria bacterium GW2011_GWF2_43_32]HBA36380.1 hypothetical protein [Candidatus Falkowbacteria bacterium]